MLTHILLDNDFDPSAVIGGKLPLTGTNGRVGKSDILVCEACEYKDTFLDLTPDISVILNVDRDHMEYFKTPDGRFTYPIPVIKVKNYTVDELFEKKLYFLIPVHIFVYENSFLLYNENNKKAHEK